MNKIQKIEALQKKWKAAEHKALKNQHRNLADAIAFKLMGLSAALKICKEPSNTAMQIDAAKR